MEKHRIHPLHQEQYVLFTLEQIKNHLDFFHDEEKNVDSNVPKSEEQIQSVLKVLLEYMQNSQDYKIISRTDVLNFAKTQKLPELVEYEKETKANPLNATPSKESEFKNQELQLSRSIKKLDEEDPLFKKNQLMTQMLSKYLNQDILPAAKKTFDDRLAQKLEKERQLELERQEKERLQRERELKRQQMQRQRSGESQVSEDFSTEENISEEPEKKKFVENPYPEPTVYICLLDFPEDVYQIRHILSSNINFDCIIGLIAKNRSGPPSRSEDEVQTQQVVDKNAKGKAAPPKKKETSAGALPQRQPSLYNQVQAAQFHVRKTNSQSDIRNPVFVPLTFYIYEYADDMQEFNTGNDTEFEGKRLFELLEKNLKMVAFDHRDYYNSQIKHNVLVPKSNSIQASMKYYNNLLSNIPPERTSIPVLLYCMLEQVVKNIENTNEETDFVADDKKVEDESLLIEDTLDSLFTSFQNTSNGDIQQNIDDDGLIEESPISPDKTNLKRPSHLSVGMSNPPSYEPKEYISSKNRDQSSALQDDSHPPIIEYGDKLSLFKKEGTIQGRSLFSIEMEMLSKLDIFPQMSSFDIDPINKDIPNVTSSSERGARLVELHNFMAKDASSSPRQSHSSNSNIQKYIFSMKQLQKELILFRFENLIQQFFQKEGQTESISFSDRIYQEDFSNDTFIQVLARFASHLGNTVSIHSKVQLLSAYYDLEDAAIIMYWQQIDRNGTKYDDSICFTKRFEIPKYYGEFQQQRQINYIKNSNIEYDSDIQKMHDDIHQKRLLAKLEAEAKERRKLERRQKALKEKEGQNDTLEEDISESKDLNTLLKVDTIEKIESNEKKSNIQFKLPKKKEVLESVSNQQIYFEGLNSNIYKESLQFYPTDGAIISLYSINTSQEHITNSESLRYRIGCSVLKDGVNFGFKTNIQNNLKASEFQDGYFSATFEDEVCLYALGTNKNNKEPHLSISTKNGLYIQQSFKTGEIFQIINPPSNTHYTHSNYETAIKRVYIGAGYKQLLRNALQNMNSFLSREDEPIQVWNPEKQTTELVLAIEKYRSIIPEDRSVIRYLETVVNEGATQTSLGIVQILNYSGEISVYHSQYDIWMKTLPNGLRFVYHHNSTEDQLQIDSIHCAMNVDTETSAQIISREDFVTQIIFQDGITQLVQFIDGTRIWQYQKRIDGSESSKTLLIEHPKYALVEINLDTDDLSIELPGTFLSTLSYNNQSLLFTKDGHEFSFSFKDESEYVIVKPASKYFQEKHKKVTLPEEFGLYYINYGFISNINEKDTESSQNIVSGGMKTIDLDGNEFFFNWDGKSVVRYRDPLQPKQRVLNDIQQTISSLDFESGKEALRLGIIGELRNKETKAPLSNAKLFLLRREDGSGCEFLSPSQCFAFIEEYKNHPATEFTEDIDKSQNLTAYTFLTEVYGKLNSLLSVKNVNLPLSLIQQKYSHKEQYDVIAHFHRRLVKFPEIDPSTSKDLKKRYTKWEEWYKSRKNLQEEFIQSLEQISEVNPNEEKIQSYIKENVLPTLQKTAYEEEYTELEEESNLDNALQISISEQLTPLKSESKMQSKLLDSLITPNQLKKSNSEKQSPTTSNYWNSPNGSKVLKGLQKEKTLDESILDEMYSLHRTISPKKNLDSTQSKIPQNESTIKSFNGFNLNNSRNIEKNEINNISNLSQNDFEDEDHSESTGVLNKESTPFKKVNKLNKLNNSRNQFSNQLSKSLRNANQPHNLSDTDFSQSQIEAANPNPLIVFPTSVKLGISTPDTILTSSFTITNVGKTPCRFIISYKNGRQLPLNVQYPTGPLPVGLNRKIVLKLDTNKLNPDETFETSIDIKFAGGTISVPVTMQ